MFVADEEAPARPHVASGISLAGDLFWVLLSAHKTSLRESHPALSRLFSAQPDLAERVVAFWGVPHPHFDELVVLAHQGGVLVGAPEPEEFVGAVLGACDRDPGPLELATEDDESRHQILERLERLRTDLALRERYGRLILEVLTAVDHEWHRAQPGLEAAQARLDRRIAEGHPVLELLPPQCPLVEKLAPAMAALSGRDWLLTVSAFAGKGAMLDLPGLMFCSFPESGRDRDAERIAELGRQLRAVADPTRLSILAMLSRSPQRIGELALALGVSQPTVSNHVKVLRDSGVVRAGSQGRRNELTVDESVVSRLLGEVGELVAGGTTEA